MIDSEGDQNADQTRTAESEMQQMHARDIDTRDELIALLKAKLAEKGGHKESPKQHAVKEHSQTSEHSSTQKSVDKSPKEPSEKGVSVTLYPQRDGTMSPTPSVASESQHVQKMRLPALPKMNGEDKENSDSFDLWLQKLEKHAELEQWSDRQKLLQFELHLVGKAEKIYNVLDKESKKTYASATKALRDRLCPVRREALKSAELLRRKQQQNESVDEFAQDFEALFERSYGRAGMDDDARERLKRDLFVQGLQYRWQEKVLPTATTFCDALYQARANEEQAKQLSYLQKQHESRSNSTRSSTAPRSTPNAHSGGASGGASGGGRTQPQNTSSDRQNTSTQRSNERTGGGRWHQGSRFNRSSQGCRNCHSRNHHWRDCPQREPPSETPGSTQASSSTVVSKSADSPELDQPNTEFSDMVETYRQHAQVDQVTGPIGPLYYARVQIAGVPTDGLVDTGSSVTILSFSQFKEIGKQARIPSSELKPAVGVFRDYSRRLIPITARVDLEFQWKGKSVITPAYLRADDENGVEPCLPGTNVTTPLGLMTPASGVEPRGEQSEQKPDSPLHPEAVVRLIQAQRIPGHSDAVVYAQLDGPISRPEEVLFEPNDEWLMQTGLQVEDCLLTPDEDRKIV